MKIFCLALGLIFCSGTIFAKAPAKSAKPEVRWENYSEALAAAKSDKKMIFVDIVADWCLPCREMDKTTYRDETVVKILNERFHPVRLNQESQDSIVCDGKRLPADRCFFDVWNLQAVPSYVLIAPKGLSILTYSQGLDAEQMNLLLLQFLDKEKEWIEQ